MEAPPAPAKNRAARLVTWLHDDVVFMLGQLLELEPLARPNKMAGVKPWSVIFDKFLARGVFECDPNF
jgi:hypothetical protein